MTNTPESDNMNILDIAKEHGATKPLHTMQDAPYVLINEAQLLATLHAYNAKTAEKVVVDVPTYHYEAMGCGLEDRNITDRYEAMQYGWECAIDRVFEQIPDAQLYININYQNEYSGNSG